MFSLTLKVCQINSNTKVLFRCKSTGNSVNEKIQKTISFFREERDTKLLSSLAEREEICH